MSSRHDDVGVLDIGLADPAEAGEIVEVIHAAFGARPEIGPPPAALRETEESVRQMLDAGFGVVARVDGQIAGVVLVGVQEADGVPTTVHWRRVSTHPDHQRLGIASAMIETAEELSALRGALWAQLDVRVEYPGLLAWWRRAGYTPMSRGDRLIRVGRELPVTFEVPTAEQMQELGAWVARLVRPGDVIIASGDLGAGKTTFTQGLGAGLGVAEAVTSPTFVLSRIHPGAGEGPDLVHVDAYRLGDGAEVDDLDLDATAEGAVTVIEWGQGVAEHLSPDRLEISIERGTDPGDDTRFVFLRGVGKRWEDLHRRFHLSHPEVTGAQS